MNREWFIKEGWPVLDIASGGFGKIIVFVGSEDGMQEALKYDSLEEFHQEMIRNDRGWEL